MFKASITFKRKHFYLAADLVLKKGSITALVGASGSGKSTLFRLLSGLEKPDSGRIASDDICWFDGEVGCGLSPQNRKVGMVFQEYQLFEHMTVFDNIAFGVEKAKRDVVVPAWLKRINLQDKASAHPQDLSGGEKQRVALARALANSPDILLLDEPFSALDAHFRHELRRQLQNLIKDTQIPVLMATHDLEEARFLANSVYVMSEGKTIQHGSVSEVFQHPKSIAAARVLGWQNILPVNAVAEHEITGEWGSLAIRDANQDTQAAILPVDAIQLVGADKNCRQTADLSCTQHTLLVSHFVDMGSYSLIEASFPNGSRIVLRTTQVHSLQIDEKINIHINLHQVVLLSN